jgi:hypothetical protein
MSIINFAQIDGLYTEQQRRVAALIKELFPTVRLLRMEPGHPSFDPERQFALVDEPHMLPPYHIRNLAETEIDHRLVAWLAENNMHDPNSSVNRIQLLEMSYALLKAKEEEDWHQEKADVMKSAMRSTKNSWTHEGKTLRK